MIVLLSIKWSIVYILVPLLMTIMLDIYTFLSYASKFDDFEHAIINKYGWFKIFNEKYPDNRALRSFFTICIDKGIIIMDEKTNLYRLSKNYSDLVRNIIDEQYPSFIDYLSHYYNI